MGTGSQKSEVIKEEKIAVSSDSILERGDCLKGGCKELNSKRWKRHSWKKTKNPRERNENVRQGKREIVAVRVQSNGK